MKLTPAIVRAVVPFACLFALMRVEPAAASQPYVHGVDVPSDLTGTLLTPGQIALNDANLHTLVLNLPSMAEISAIQAPVQNTWALSFAAPVQLGGLWVEPRDVVTTDGVSYSVLFDGSAAGVPEGARIDALAIGSSGTMQLSFDVPVRLGSVEYGPSDVVSFSGGVFTLAWSGAAHGIPAHANLVGLDNDAGGTVISLDVAVSVGGSTFTPGSLVQDSGGSLVLKNLDPAWPAGSQLRDFAYFTTGAGAVPSTGTSSLNVTYNQTAALLTLSWGASCASYDADFEVYVGTLPPNQFTYNHTSLFCTTGGASAVTFTPGHSSTYYLIVPHNGIYEGSYGAASNGTEIPAGSTSCRPSKLQSNCQ